MVTVPALTLDTWAEQNQCSRIDFLWLDMQGGELAAIQAAPHLLVTVQAIHLEVTTAELYENNPLYPEVRAWLEAQGFRLETEALADATSGNTFFVRPAARLSFLRLFTLTARKLSHRKGHFFRRVNNTIMTINRKLTVALFSGLGLAAVATLAYKGRGKGLRWYTETPLYAYRKIRHIRDVYRGHEQFVAASMATGFYDEKFQAVLRSCGSAVMGEGQLFFLYQLARNAHQVPGEAAEVGVYQGGTAQMLAALLPEKPFHLFDTFEGMPTSALPHEYHQAGDFSGTSLAEVKAALQACSNARFHQGFFPETAQAVAEKQFSFVHLDGDLYQTTKDGCEFFYPRMSPGGVLVFHDYGLPSCPGVRQAVEEYFAGKPEEIVSVGVYQAFVVKQP